MEYEKKSPFLRPSPANQDGSPGRLTPPAWTCAVTGRIGNEPKIKITITGKANDVVFNLQKIARHR